MIRTSMVATLAVATGLGFALSPARGSIDQLLKLRASYPVSLHELGSIYSFTPSTRDPHLAEAYAKAVLSHRTRSFRFTPTSGSMSGSRSITVLVRAPEATAGPDRGPASPVGIAPLAFNLDASRGWRKFSLPDSVGGKPLDPVVSDLPGAKGFSLDRTRPRSSGPRTTDSGENRANDTVGSPSLPGERKVGVDLGSSYSLTHSLDVTAGVRYVRPDSRINPITDERKDNQAVYLGTVVKF